MQNKTRIQIADSLGIVVFDSTDLYYLPDHICTLSSITFAEGCAWQFVTIALPPEANIHILLIKWQLSGHGLPDILLAYIQFPVPAIHFCQ